MVHYKKEFKLPRRCAVAESEIAVAKDQWRRLGDGNFADVVGGVAIDICDGNLPSQNVNY